MIGERQGPRPRRAFADSAIRTAIVSGSLSDYRAAYYAVERVGNSPQDRDANFHHRLACLALRDESTRIIVTAAKQTLDPVGTPAVYDDYFRDWVQLRVSPDYVPGHSGAFIEGSFTYDDSERRYANFSISSYDDSERGNGSYRIPLLGDAVDVCAVRLIPDDVRFPMAHLALRIDSSAIPHVNPLWQHPGYS